MANLSPIDRTAFDQALVIARKDPAYSRRIDQQLAAGAGHDEVGRSAAYHCQIV